MSASSVSMLRNFASPKTLTQRIVGGMALCLSLAALVPLSLLAQSSDEASLAARAGSGLGVSPLVGFKSPQELKIEYKGDAAAAALEHAEPSALAIGDFNADGAPDVVAAYSTGHGGVVTLLMGNPDAFAPSDESLFEKAQHGVVAPSFLPGGAAYLVPESPDMVLVGDFNDDGNKDVLVAARGGNLFLLAGDGHGCLAEAKQVELPGRVWAMAEAGNHRVAVSTNGANGPEVLLLSVDKNGMTAGASWPLPAHGDSIVWGSLGGKTDLAVGAGSTLVLVYDPMGDEPKTERVNLPRQIVGLEVGSFIWNRDNLTSIAALGDDGAVRILQHGELDTRPLTPADLHGRRAYLREKNRQVHDPLSLGTWTVAKTLQTTARPAGPLAHFAFSSPHLAASATSDLMILDGVRNELTVFETSGKTAQSSEGLSLPGAAVAALVLPRKIDGSHEVVVLANGHAGPLETPLLSSTTYNVTTTTDEDTAGACGQTSTKTSGNETDGTLSLRTAICEANNLSGSNATINVPSGTYQLTISTFGGNGSANSSQELQIGMENAAQISIVGAGASSTFIEQRSVSDRLIEQDEVGYGNVPISLSAVTLRGGHLTDSGLDPSFEGGGITAGGVVGDDLTLTNVTMSGNVVDLLATSYSDDSGGALIFAGGAMTITNSTFSTNNANSGNSNQQGMGGAIAYVSDVSPSSGSITGTTFANNTGTNGGALNLSPDNGETFTITGSTFTGNEANNPNSIDGSGIGGAILLASSASAGKGTLTMTNSRITGNTAANSSTEANPGGTGVFVQAYSFANVINNWWGCNGNPDPEDTQGDNGPRPFTSGQTLPAGCDYVVLWYPSSTEPNETDATSPYLVLSISANPTSVATGSTSTLTTAITKNSAGASGFSVPTGTPVSFGGAVLGTLSGAASSLTSGSGTATYTAGSTPGSGSATATVDNQTVTANITVTAATVTHFAVSAPGSATAGAPFTFIVTAEAASNATDTGYSGTVHFTSSDGSAILPPSATLTNGVGTFSATLKTAATQTITATDTVTGSITGTSGSILVSAAAASHFTVSAPSSATAGTSISLSVTALDVYGNTATGYSGTVHFTSTDGQAVLPANATLTNGVGTFTNSATLKTSATQTITATDTVTGSITGTSGSILVSAAAASHFTVSAPSSATAGTSISLSVTALDAYGNTATSYSGTVHFTSSDGQAVLPANATLTNGVGTFTNGATLKTSATQTITATDDVTGSITGTSGSILVSAAAASHFSVSMQSPRSPGIPASTAYVGLPITVYVTAFDAYNNTASGYTGTVAFSSSDGSAVLPANSTLTSGVGTFTLAARLFTLGSQSLTATDTVTASIAGSTLVTVDEDVPVAADSTITLSASTTTAGGPSITVTGTFEDQFGNPIYNAPVTVTASGTGNTIVPVGFTNILPLGSGAITIASTKAQVEAVTFSVGSPVVYQFTSSSFTITSGPAASFTILTPSSAVTGTPFQFTALALDAYGNPVSDNVEFSSSDSAASLPASGPDSGSADTFIATLNTVGNQTITVTDSANSVTGTSGTITVAVPNLVVNTANDDAGTASNCTVQAAPGTNGSDSACSLRDALLEATSLGSGIITFDSGAFASAKTITLSNATTLTISSNTSITGPSTGSGPTLTNLVTVNGNNVSGLTDFTVAPSAINTSISGLTISGGNGAGQAGGIINGGTLALSNSIVTGNTASGGSVEGGGILNGGTLTVTNSTVSSNTIPGSTPGFGAGIFNSSLMTVTNSTISGNSISGVNASGGGIWNDGTLTVTNSTISGNSISGSNGFGGGIGSFGPTTVVSSTISGNSLGTTRGAGGGVGAANSSFTLTNSIVSGNTAPSDTDFAGTYTDNGGNQVSTAVMLAPLANYGGTTQTMILLPGSTAICDLSGPGITGLTSDQRGLPRVTTYGATTCIDAGAVQTSYALAFTVQPPSSTGAGVALSPAPAVTLTESGAVFAPATSSVTMTDADSGLSASGTNSAALASGTATFTNLIMGAAETGDTLTASLSLNPNTEPPLTITSSPSTGVTVSALSTLISPTPGSVLGTSNITFQWGTGAGATEYQLYLGTTGPGSSNLAGYRDSGNSVTLISLPANGVTVYARLSSYIGGVWQFIDYTYTESPAPIAATLTTPTPGLGTVLGASNVTFQWTTGSGINLYQLNLSAIAPGQSELFSFVGSATSATVSNLPAKGQVIYARLSSYVNGAWQSHDYQYTEVGSNLAAVITSPASGLATVLGTSNVAFQWTTGTGITEYQLSLGTTPGAQDLFFYKGKATSVTVPTLPANGQIVYARLYSEIDGTWVSGNFTYYNDYGYTESGTPAPAALTSPTPGRTTVLGTSNVAFQWNAGKGVSNYQLTLGTTGAGASDLYIYKGTATTATVTSLPSKGLLVYARLSSLINGVWQNNDYLYTETGATALAALQTPTPGLGTVLGASNVSFGWTTGSGATLYQLTLSAIAPGQSELFIYKGSATSTTAVSLPANGVTVYARLYSYINGTWQYNDYVYTEQ